MLQQRDIEGTMRYHRQERLTGEIRSGTSRSGRRRWRGPSIMGKEQHMQRGARQVQHDQEAGRRVKTTPMSVTQISG